MKTVAVIFGGRSTEHDVSIVTAIASVIKPLEASGQYNVEPVYITKDGSWLWDKRLKDIKIFQTGDIDKLTKKLPKVQLSLAGGLTLVKPSQLTGRRQHKKIDIVFPAMHGTHGEDGELMGLLQMANVPFVGCDMTSSALAMDKVLAKLIAEAYGAYIAKMQFITTVDLEKHPAAFTKAVNSRLKYPLFVKPAHLGSSIGITKVDTPEALTNALEVAAHYDTKILVEEAVQNLIEVTLPIIGNEEPIPALLERPLVSADDFFDFDAKYIAPGGKKGGKGGGKKGAQGYSQIPADLPERLYEEAVQTGLQVYRALGCSGIARVDMLIDSKAGKVYFNEVNPLPGGLYAHNWNKAGVSAVDLVTKLVSFAEERWQSQQKKNVTFSTNYLKQF